MTGSRNSDPAIKPVKKLIDNLERVADELIIYTLEVATVYEQIEHIQNAREHYKNTWLWFIYKRFSRLRDAEAVAVINKLHQCGSGLAVLEELDKAYSHGGMRLDSSLNPYWLLDMALALPGYADTHENCSLSEKDLKKLRKLFLIRADKVLRPTASTTEKVDDNVDIKKLTLTEQKVLSKQQQAEVEKQQLDELAARRLEERKNELKAIRKIRKLDKTTENLLASTLFKSKQNADVHKLDENKYGDLKKKLERDYEDRLFRRDLIDQKTQTVNEEGGKMKFEVKKLNPALIKEMDVLLGGRLKSAAKEYEELRTQEIEAEAVLAVTAPQATQLCAAAFEAPVVSKPITKDPQKLVLSEEHKNSLNRLFGGTPVTKDVEDDYVSSEEISPPASPTM